MPTFWTSLPLQSIFSLFEGVPTLDNFLEVLSTSHSVNNIRFVRNFVPAFNLMQYQNSYATDRRCTKSYDHVKATKVHFI